MPDQDISARDAHVADVLKVMRAVAVGGTSAFQEGSVLRLLRRLLPGPRQGDLFEEAPARDGERLIEAARAVVGEEQASRELDIALAVKMALVVGHIQAGRWDLIGAKEAKCVATILRRHVPARVFEGAGDGQHGEGSRDDGPVEFAFP